MNNEQFDDLKQFVASTVSQSEERLGQRIDSLESEMKGLRSEMRAGFAGVGDAIDVSTQVIEHRLDDHETRITLLEGAT